MKKMRGFTLIEVLLVLVIISVIIFASLRYVQQKALNQRIDRTSLQMQQILNAGLSFYVINGRWPGNIGEIRSQGYIPSTLVRSPFGEVYDVVKTTPPSGPFLTPPELMVVFTPIKSPPGTRIATGIANSIAGLLPMAYTSTASPAGQGTTCTTSGTCYVIAMVGIPGQNLNNARAINFAGLYHHGACIPVPQCPVDVTQTALTPQVFVVPVSVSGVNDEGNTNVYPISSFTAFATAMSAPGQEPPACPPNDLPAICQANPPSNQYWRACMQVVTEKGTVSVMGWGENVTMAAFTRCGISNEPAGSGFTVFSNPITENP